MPPTPSTRILQLELELDEARRQGRWLSDEERAALELERRQQQEALEQERRQRRKLMVLAVVALLIPPLWPLAVGLVLYLLFPVTVGRLALATGLSLLALALLSAALVTALVVALLLALF